MEDVVYDISKVKDFLEKLALAYNKHQKKGYAKQKLDTHFEKVKNLALEKNASKRRIESNFKILEQHINDVLKLEKEMLSKGDNKVMTKELKQRIGSLEEKFDKYTKLIQGRKKHIKDLERKIKRTTKIYERYPHAKKRNLSAIIIDETKDNSSLKNKLYALEEKYYELKINGTPESQLKNIKEKIDKIKSRL
jgi:small-conductance mechanosensitive channel